MNEQICINTFVEVLDELSSVDLQVKLWLNIENETGLISSYTELMENVSGTDFNYVVHQLVQDASLKADLVQLLALLDAYEEPKSYVQCRNDVYIVADPVWKKIRDFAKAIKQIHSVYLKQLQKR
ncbi:MAG: hypothetical protein AAGG75_18330 [Bacteroidota bacterium]